MKYLFLLLAIPFFLSCNTNKSNESETEVKENVEAVDSLKYLSDNINRNSQDAFHWAKRAKYFFRIGNVNDAKHDYEEAILRDSTNANYRVKYADVLIAYLDLAGAKYNYEYALKYDSLNANAYVGMGHIYTLLDNPGMATVYLNKAYSINKNLPSAYFLEGLIYRADFDKTKREESWTRSKSSFQTATELKPDYFEAYIMLGDMNTMEDNDLAIDYYSSAIDAAPQSSLAWYSKGTYYQSKKKYEQAKYCYRKIVGFDSLYFDAHYNQGYIQLSIDREYDSAIYFFKAALNIDSLSARAYNNLGLSQEYKGDKEGAIRNYKKAIEIDPEFELARKNLRIVTN
ncbi:MAG: tetratricopeptide repeat protein [Crocinitomicaceae bacterium]